MFSLPAECHNKPRINVNGKAMIKQASRLLSEENDPLSGQLLWTEYQGVHTSYHFLKPLMTDIPVAADTAVPWYMRIASLFSMLKATDDDTARHCQRVSVTTLALGVDLGLPASEIQYLRWGSLLHDIGKIIIDPMIKNKPEKLTPEEYKYIECHARAGAEMVRQVMGDKVAGMIEHHHDHYNGEGHNQSVSGEDIPLGARIIAVADAFDAMVFDRPYRFAMTKEEAGEEIRRCANTQFDPRVVEGFINIMR
jgi:putative two-component system response regulator